MHIKIVDSEYKLCLSCMEEHKVFQVETYEDGRYSGAGDWCEVVDEITRTSSQFEESLRLHKLSDN